MDDELKALSSWEEVRDVREGWLDKPERLFTSPEWVREAVGLGLAELRAEGEEESLPPVGSAIT